MVGAKPEFQTFDCASPVMWPGAFWRTRMQTAARGAAARRWRWIAPFAMLLPLSFVLVQCGKAPNAEMLARQFAGLAAGLRANPGASRLV